MSKYIYRGPTSGITLRGDKGAKTEVMLFDGMEIDLPDCAEVKTLVALKRLQPVAPAAAESAAASKAAAPAVSAAADPAVDVGASSPAAAPASQKKGA